MAKPLIELKLKYFTTPKVREILGLSAMQFEYRIKRGILPAPTVVGKGGVRYFDQEWVRHAKVILESTPGTVNGEV
jgi:DNA-binding transcriptional MerR regulator